MKFAPQVNRFIRQMRVKGNPFVTEAELTAKRMRLAVHELSLAAERFTESWPERQLRIDRAFDSCWRD